VALSRKGGGCPCGKACAKGDKEGGVGKRGGKDASVEAHPCPLLRGRKERSAADYGKKAVW